jgi:hypothetical protein
MLTTLRRFLQNFVKKIASASGPTHITELLRNGANLTEVMGLARHGDIRMTMKYAHIGIEDQAKALKALPIPCHDIVRKLDVFQSPELPDSDLQIICELHLLHTKWPQISVESRNQILHFINSMFR